MKSKHSVSEDMKNPRVTFMYWLLFFSLRYFFCFKYGRTCWFGFPGLNFSAVLYAAWQPQNMSWNAKLWTVGDLCFNPNVTLSAIKGVWLWFLVFGFFFGMQGEKKEKKLHLKPLYKKVVYLKVMVQRLFTDCFKHTSSKWKKSIAL